MIFFVSFAPSFEFARTGERRRVTTGPATQSRRVAPGHGQREGQPGGRHGDARARGATAGAAPWLLNQQRRSRRERERWQRHLEAAGIRPFPYPFASMLAIVSDTDATLRRYYDFYTGYLVGTLGLDFGDSFRLVHMPDRYGGGGQAICPFDCLEPPFHSDDRDPEDFLSGLEILREHYLGNGDHLHGITNHGPKLLPLPVVDDGREAVLRLALAPLRPRFGGARKFRTRHMPVAGIAVCTAGSPLPDGTSAGLEVAAADGPARLPLTACDGAGERWTPRFSPADEHCALFETAPAPPALLEDIEAVVVEFPSGRPRPAVVALHLLTALRPGLVRLLRRLAGEFNVRTSLFTDHGAHFFLNAGSERHHRRSATRRHARGETLCSLEPGVDGERLRFTSLGDDPASFAYLLPELRRLLGLRFINPAGTSGVFEDRVRLGEAALPAAARDGSRVHIARRMMPGMDGLLARRRALASDTGTRSIAARLARVMRLASREPHTVWPVYTHLGNLSARAGAGTGALGMLLERVAALGRAAAPAGPGEDAPRRPDIEPYFPGRVFAALQDRVFGVSGRVRAQDRIWFVRASTLYDYDLVLQQVAEHVHRPDERTVEIRSWHDPVLDAPLPASPAQLNGLTFYVPDAGRARVLLDGEPVRALVRNGPDASTRESVTIVGIGARHLLFDEVDPRTQGWDAQCDPGLDVDWQCDGPAFAGRGALRLRLRADGCRRLRLAPTALQPVGAQYFAYAVRASADGARAGFAVRTRGGGRFLFGQVDADEAGEDVHASYPVPAGPAGEWRYCLVPFHDLRWAAGARPGHAMPSHPVAAIDVVLAGARGAEIWLDRVEFVRPSSCPPRERVAGCVLGGRVADPPADARVTLRYDGADGVVERACALEHPLGFYWFTGVPDGTVATVRLAAAGVLRTPERGRLIEVCGDDLSVDFG